jgi:hypothetical protein
LRVARRRRAERFYACGALERFRAARSTRTLGIVDTLVVPDVEERGLKAGFQTLTPHERDVFSIWDLHLYFEMEGSFADHIPNAPEKFDWLEGTLERIGDLGSLRIIRALRSLNGEVSSRAHALCQEFADRSEFRLKCLEQYLLDHGVRLKWIQDDA